MAKEYLPYKKFSYDEHARTCASDDFLGQVRRTQHGEPVTDEQVKMIVTAIKAGLSLKSDDLLIELACGNGALSQYLFDSCKGYLGVDLSEHLISIAKQNFEQNPHYSFLEKGAMAYVLSEQQPERFNKMLCYAGFQYFSDDEAVELLSCIFKKFIHVKTIFLGSLPDKNLAEEFCKPEKPNHEELSDCKTAIGIWRTRDELEALAARAGWKATFTTMPTDFYASYYRYDTVLCR